MGRGWKLGSGVAGVEVGIEEESSKQNHDDHEGSKGDGDPCRGLRERRIVGPDGYLGVEGAEGGEEGGRGEVVVVDDLDTEMVELRS